jgi:hypothetical protein
MICNMCRIRVFLVSAQRIYMGQKVDQTLEEQQLRVEFFSLDVKIREADFLSLCFITLCLYSYLDVV